MTGRGKAIGFTMREEVGISAINPRAVRKAGIRTVRRCPVCGEEVPDLAVHAWEVDDPEHRVMEVMES